MNLLDEAYTALWILQSLSTTTLPVDYWKRCCYRQSYAGFSASLFLRSASCWLINSRPKT